MVRAGALTVIARGPQLVHMMSVKFWSQLGQHKNTHVPQAAVWFGDRTASNKHHLMTETSAESHRRLRIFQKINTIYSHLDY